MKTVEKKHLAKACQAAANAAHVLTACRSDHADDLMPYAGPYRLIFHVLNKILPDKSIEDALGAEPNEWLCFHVRNAVAGGIEFDLNAPAAELQIIDKARTTSRSPKAKMAIAKLANHAAVALGSSPQAHAFARRWISLVIGDCVAFMGARAAGSKEGAA